MTIYDVLNKLNILYDEVTHGPVYTALEAQYINNMIEGKGCKNLFLKDRSNYYLVILDDNKRADLKQISNIVGASHLSFASEDELISILNLKRGSVTPFGIVNDKENKVIILIDSELKNNKLLFHPNINTKTISIDFNDLIRFIEYENHKYYYM